MNVEQVARLAHETNRAYCQSIGDNSQPAWHEAPEWQKSSAINGVNFHLDHLRNGTQAPPSASHDAWLKQKQEEGWSFGPVKDPEKKEHPCFVPYGDLPLEQRMKDYLFSAVVKAFYDCLKMEKITSAQRGPAIVQQICATAEASVREVSSAEADMAAAEDEIKRLVGSDKPLFEAGQRVRVDHPRFRGNGIVQYDSGARSRVIGVTLENGNTWEYEVETVELVQGDPQ